MVKPVCFAAFVSAVLASCSLIDVRDEVSYGYGNTPVPQATLKQIKSQQTTTQWLLDNLGNPSLISEGKDGAEIYTYRFEEQHRQRSRILFLFSYRVTEVIPRYIYISVKDNKVQRVWQDGVGPDMSPDESQPIDSTILDHEVRRDVDTVSIFLI